jgi:DNA-binding transcriptional regulator YiaG
MKNQRESLFHRLKSGLEEGIRYAKGELTLKTTEPVAAPPKLTPAQIVGAREAMRMSQAALAETLGVSVKTVQSCEQGVRKPSKLASRFLQVLSAEPDIVCGVIGTRNGK